MATAAKDLYSVLGVPKGAPADVVKKPNDPDGITSYITETPQSRAAAAE